MRISFNEIWLEEPVETVLERIKNETKQVTFGLFNIYNSKHQDLDKECLGEIKYDPLKIKLFRVIGKENTSDFSVTAHLNQKNNKPILAYNIKIHFTFLFGFFGIGFFFQLSPTYFIVKVFLKINFFWLQE